MRRSRQSGPLRPAGERADCREAPASPRTARPSDDTRSLAKLSARRGLRRAGLELQLVEASIEAGKLHQLIVSADGRDAAGINDNDAVGALHGREPVSNDHRRPAPHQIPDRLLYLGLGLGVEPGHGLIENQYRRIFEQRPSDRETLSLSAGELQAELTYNRLVPVGKCADKAIGTGRSRSSVDIFVVDPRATVRDVVAHGIVEKKRELRDHGDLRTQ